MGDGLLLPHLSRERCLGKCSLKETIASHGVAMITGWINANDESDDARMLALRSPVSAFIYFFLFGSFHLL